MYRDHRKGKYVECNFFLGHLVLYFSALPSLRFAVGLLWVATEEMFGNTSFNNIRIALDNDVIAQVRPSMAAALIVNCVYGLDVTL